jgi:hypothetical protein
MGRGGMEVVVIWRMGCENEGNVTLTDQEHLSVKKGSIK